jgi:hypothetical protein
MDVRVLDMDSDPVPRLDCHSSYRLIFNIATALTTMCNTQLEFKGKTRI